MATSDTVVGIVGAIILTGAMVAVFYYENQTVDEGPGTVIGDGAESFTFTYERSEDPARSGGTTLDGHQASLAEGAEKKWEFDVPAYAWNVTATIEWEETGDTAATTPLASGPDTFSLHIVSPTGVEYDPQEGSGGKLTSFHFHATEEDVTPPEKTVVVRADSEADAREKLDNSTDEAHGKGTWTAVVELVDTGSGPSADQDAGNEYTITVAYEYWEPVLESDTTGVPPQSGSDDETARLEARRVV